MCLWLILVIPAASFASEWQFEDVDRIVAISDIHGAYDAMVRTLQNAGVIAEDLAWSGGETHLVIVGDILDRGPNSRDAMDLLIRLEGEFQLILLAKERVFCFGLLDIQTNGRKRTYPLLAPIPASSAYADIKLHGRPGLVDIR